MTEIGYCLESINSCIKCIFFCVLLHLFPINIYGINTYTTTVVVHEHGQVSYNEKNYREESFSVTYSEIESVNIVVTPNEGYTPRIVDDSGGRNEWGDKRCAPIEITLYGWTPHKRIDVYFDEIPNQFTTYTTTVVVHEHGQVSYNEKNYREESFSVTYSEIESVNIVVTPDEGYTPRIVDDSGGRNEWGDKRCAPIEITLYGWTPHKRIDAYFDKIQSTTYSLSVKATGNGSASCDGITAKNETKTLTLNEGTSATITFSPDNGYRIKNVKVNSTDVTSSVANNSYTISCISANTTLEVEFEAIPIPTYTLSVKATGNGSATYNGTTAKNNTKTFTLNEGTSATITFTPDNGYRIKSVKLNSTDVTSKVSNNSYTISSISANTTLEVEFEVIPIPTYTLYVKAIGNGSATYNGTSAKNNTQTFTLNEGTSATITFAPDNGYRIKSVKVNNADVTSSVSNNSYTVSNIKANTTIEVEFEAIPIPTYTLSIKASGNGSATYSGTTAKNNTQTFTLNEGTSATITFAPDNGYRIKSVKVNSTDVTTSVPNNQYTISNIKANTTLEVEFEAIPIPTYTLSVKASGNGSATYSGTTAKNNTQTFTLNEGTSATITFAPDNGYRIKSVKVNSADVTSGVSNNGYTVSNIKANTTVEVEFEAIPIPTYTLSFKASGNGSATYNGTTAKNNTQTFTLNEGTSATITFAPDNGYRIKSVKVNSVDVTSSVSNNSYTVSNIKANTTVEVEFEAIPIPTYTLSVKASGNGSATYSGTTAKNNTQTFILNEGTSATITFAPDNGYRIKSVKVNSADVTSNVSNNSYTVSNIKANTTLEVEFEAIPIPTYTLSVKASGNGSATYSGTTAKNNTQTFTLNEGTSATITFAPDNGYRIKSVKVNSADVTSSVSNSSYTVSNIKANTAVEVEFEAIPINSYILKYVVDGVTYQTYQIQEGATITPEAKPTKEGYTFSGWSEIPQIMPSMDVTVTGSFIVNKYKLTYQVDGVEYKSYDVEYGATITPEAFPTKDGYTFSGWSEIPKTMPAKDITVVGTFTKDEPVINTYTLTLTASGNGSATFNNTTAKNDSKTFTLNEGTSATIAFTPDNGYRIKSVKVNSVDVTSSVSNNNYTVSNIKDNTTVNVEFEAIPTTDTTPISGDKFEVDGITYVVNNDVNTVSVTSGNAKYSGDVAIPSSVVYQGNTYIVTSIGSWAFAFCEDLTSVTIPNSVTSIDMDAFQECSLTSITIPNSVTDIRFEAFRNCSLTSVTIPSSVSSIGYGAFFGCDLTTITSEIENPFEIEESVFDGIPSDAQLIVPKGTKAAYQETEGWNLFANIVEAGDAEPDQPGQININDILYKVTGSGEVEVVSAENGVTSITIPSSVSYNNTVYKVTSIAKDAFETCEHLSAVIWEPEAQFNAKVNNPNFLLYVSDEKYASRSVKNVVVNGVAESIELTDAANGNDFYCPRAFSARNIVYSHNYQMETGIGDSRGWETIVLPFDVQKYTHATKGELESFTTWSKGSNKKPFWLFELTASGYKDVAGIKANTPYIISMPNNQQYEQQYQIPGIVTFSASDVEVKKSDNLIPTNYQGRTFVPNYTNQNKLDFLALNVSNNYVTNPSKDIAGSRFIRGLRAIHPFEAYMTTTDNTRSIDVMEGMTTSIRGIQIVKDEASTIKVYDTRGVLMKTATNKDDVRNGLKAGVYIVNGKKMVIK